MLMLARTGNRFRVKMKTIAGREFLGDLQEPPPTLGFNLYFQPRRMMRVGSAARINPGDVILGPNNRRYVCADHGENVLHSVINKTFLLYEVDKTLKWERFKIEHEPVANLQVAYDRTNLGNIYAALEKTDEKVDELNVQKPRYRMITASAVEEGDLIDTDLKVLFVERRLGVYIATVQ